MQVCPTISEWVSETGVGWKSDRSRTKVGQGLDGWERVWADRGVDEHK